MFQKHINEAIKKSGKLPFLFVFLFGGFCSAQIDKTKYITIDEIKPGMDAVCLTVYKGVDIEKFNFKVVDIIKGIEPDKNAILVMGTDERFIHSGPIAGCSGSPVYINNRLAGAISFGWSFSKDPLYGVTPIEEMLRAGKYKIPAKTELTGAFDFSKPIDLKTAYNKLINYKNNRAAKTGINYLPCPITTTLPLDSFADCGLFESDQICPLSGGSSGNLPEYKDVPMKPGGILAVPLVYGDVDLAAIATITEVADGKVYGFGHDFTGEGPVDLPMATGFVHTIVSGLRMSFKLGQTIDVKGALYADESTAVVGTIGKKAQTIPMHIKVNRFNDEKTRTYDCRIASNHLYTPLITKICLEGTAEMLGPMPTEHSIKYKAKIGIDGLEPIYMENFSSDNKLEDYTSDTIGALAIIMNNPYRKAAITSLDFDVNIMPKTLISHIWSFDVSQTNIKPGQTINASITLESYHGGLKNYKEALTIPGNIQPGNYKLLVCGAEEYEQFLVKMAPYKFIPENLPGLVKVINTIANNQRTQLHLVLILPPGGISIESAQLPQLPLSKTILLNSEKRSIDTKPAGQWLEKTIPLDTIVIDSKLIEITVEKQ